MGESTLEWALKQLTAFGIPGTLLTTSTPATLSPFLLKSISSLELGIYLYSLPLPSQNPRLVHAHTSTKLAVPRVSLSSRPPTIVNTLEGGELSSS